jgi:prepilin-type N-terminal cleavage/methylation domain-containing protein
MLVARWRHGHDQRGDTIVEVLIAMAVMSLVLGGAYVTTNRSLLAARDAQEHSQALKLAQTQVEEIKAIAASNPDSLFVSPPAVFCIDSTPKVIDVAVSPGACAVNSKGSPATAEPIYHTTVKSGAPSDPNFFTVQMQWLSVRGTATNKLDLVYRVYQ